MKTRTNLPHFTVLHLEGGIPIEKETVSGHLQISEPRLEKIRNQALTPSQQALLAPKSGDYLAVSDYKRIGVLPLILELKRDQADRIKTVLKDSSTLKGVLRKRLNEINQSSEEAVAGILLLE